MVKQRTRLLRLFTVVAIVAVAAVSPCTAQTPPDSEAPTLLDPFDPFDMFGADDLLNSENDSDKSAEELLNEATLLLASDRLLDARTKLLKALSKDPNDYRVHQLLSGYYMVYVGHFRLSLKYIKRAEELFEAKYGPPPYIREHTRREHSNILYYLSQARLNLDNYQGSLDVLDRFTTLGYTGDWYPGSRAWVLMKLGHLKEAIRVARAGVLAGAESGRILNMLGILLSMNDQPQESLAVFAKALETELSLGSQGQPATPLNNAGEVYRELFQDDKAESSFLRATGLSDGCEHVLPTLNLVLLYIEQTKFEAAAAAIDSFEKCVAQFPLRNNEEHAALVNLARGRIDLHTGHVSRAVARFETALDGTQWFGKIGTNQNDLLAGATISLAQALRAQNYIERSRLAVSWSDWLRKQRDIKVNALRSWWLFRRARQMLVTDLNDIEDLTIRNTDSLLEYPTLGETLSKLSQSALQRRISKQREHDTRAPAQLFYDLYDAQAAVGWWTSQSTTAAIENVISRARARYDELLRTEAMLTRLRITPEDSTRYRELTYHIFFSVPAALRNHGFKLPVRFDSSNVTSEIRSAVLQGPFLEGTEASGLCVVKAERKPATAAYIARFTCPQNSAKNRTVEDSDINQVVNKLSDALFSEEINNGRNA